MHFFDDQLRKSQIYEVKMKVEARNTVKTGGWDLQMSTLRGKVDTQSLKCNFSVCFLAFLWRPTPPKSNLRGKNEGRGAKHRKNRSVLHGRTAEPMPTLSPGAAIAEEAETAEEDEEEDEEDEEEEEAA